MSNEVRISRTKRRIQNIVLTARDGKIIFTVGRFAVVSTRNLCDLFFIKKNTANKRLRSLYNANFISAHLLLGSTAPTIYTLAPQGLKTLVDQMGIERKTIRVPKTLEVADLRHRLTTNDLRVAVILGARTDQTLRLVKFLSSWEVYGVVKLLNSNIIPDALIHLKRNGRSEVYALEVDLGTESLALWKQKVRGYDDLINRAVSFFDQSDWQVLIAAPSIRRIRSISKTLLTSDHANRFYLINLSELTTETFIQKLWRSASFYFNPNTHPSLRSILND